MKKIDDCIINISKSINTLRELVLENNSHSASTYKNSEFCSLFTELLKIRAKGYLDGKYYDEAINEYTILYEMYPFDYGK